MLHVPKPRVDKLRQSFQYAGPVLYNSLPRESNSVSTFKTMYKHLRFYSSLFLINNSSQVTTVGIVYLIFVSILLLTIVRTLHLYSMLQCHAFSCIVIMSSCIFIFFYLSAMLQYSL